MKLWTITKKDILLQLRDFRALIVLIILPLVFISIIGISTGKLLGVSDSNRMLKIVYIDNINYDEIETHQFKMDVAKIEDPEEDINPDSEDYKEGSAEEKEKEKKRAGNLLIKTFNSIQKEDSFEIGDVEYWVSKLGPIDKARVVVKGDPYATAKALNENGNTNSLILVGPKFFRVVKALDASDIGDGKNGLLKDGLASLDIKHESEIKESSAHVLIGIVTLGKFFGTLAPEVLCASKGIIRKNLLKPGTCEGLEAELDQPELQLNPPKPPVESEAGNRVYQVLIPGFTVMFVFFLVNLMARSFISERDLGTLNRLRMAPVRPTTILMGKTVPFLLISIGQTVLLFVCGKILFDMSWGTQPWLLIPIIFCTSLAATSLGLLVATLVKTDSQVSAFGNFVVIILAVIGGCFMPREWMPEAMLKISLGTPHAWALEGYRAVLTSTTPNLVTVAQSCAVLLGFAFVFFLFGAYRFRNIS